MSNTASQIVRRISVVIVSIFLLALLVFLIVLGVTKILEKKPLAHIRHDGLLGVVEVRLEEEYQVPLKEVIKRGGLDKSLVEVLGTSSLEDVWKDLEKAGASKAYIAWYPKGSVFVFNTAIGEVPTDIEKKMIALFPSEVLNNIRYYFTGDLMMSDILADDDHPAVTTLPRPLEWTDQGLLYAQLFDTQLLYGLSSSLFTDAIPSQELFVASGLDIIKGLAGTVQYDEELGIYLHMAAYIEPDLSTFVSSSRISVDAIGALVNNAMTGVVFSSAQHVRGILEYLQAKDHKEAYALFESITQGLLRDVVNVVDAEEVLRKALPTGELSWGMDNEGNWRVVINKKKTDTLDLEQTSKDSFIFTHTFTQEEQVLPDGTTTNLLALDAANVKQSTSTLSGVQMRELEYGEQYQYMTNEGERFAVANGTGALLWEGEEKREYFPYGASYAMVLHRSQFEPWLVKLGVGELMGSMERVLLGGRLLKDRVTFTIYTLDDV